MAGDRAETLDLAIRLLRHEAGDSQDPRLIVEAADGITHRLCDHLAVVVGRAGVSAIILRALKLTRAEFPFLDVEPLFEQDCFLTGLAESAQGRDPAEVMEAVSALLANLLGLLYRMFGTTLARRLLQDALPETQID